MKQIGVLSNENKFHEFLTKIECVPDILILILRGVYKQIRFGFFDEHYCLYGSDWGSKYSKQISHFLTKI